MLCFFVFFKQKTAYEMRISDWSSDVCSSDLLRRLVAKGNPMPSLFDPVQLGALTAPNRILMAPLTRGRATRDHVPTPIMAEYYAQRASAGLIISEIGRASGRERVWK